MRARMKRRQMYRRVVIVVAVVGILALLIVGFYFAYSAANQFSPDVGKLVSSSDISTLQQLSAAPYGPSGSSLLPNVKNYTGTPFTSDGKPLLVYIGADYCPFCASQRWAMVLALLRFGNFTNLSYMASSPSEGDYVTFSFHGSSYTSKYLVFQAFEQQDRNNQPLDAVPSNYTGAFSQYGSSYPFMNFGNRYIISGSLIPPDLLNGKNWSTVMNEIRSGTNLGTDIKESANVITALICTITSNQPGSVCNQSPINGLVISIDSYVPSAPGMVAPSSSLLAVVPADLRNE